MIPEEWRARLEWGRSELNILDFPLGLMSTWTAKTAEVLVALLQNSAYGLRVALSRKTQLSSISNHLLNEEGFFSASLHLCLAVKIALNLSPTIISSHNLVMGKNINQCSLSMLAPGWWSQPSCLMLTAGQDAREPRTSKKTDSKQRGLHAAQSRIQPSVTWDFSKLLHVIRHRQEPPHYPEKEWSLSHRLSQMCLLPSILLCLGGTEI